jgi:hypothetical protein
MRGQAIKMNHALAIQAIIRRKPSWALVGYAGQGSEIRSPAPKEDGAGQVARFLRAAPREELGAERATLAESPLKAPCYFW